MLSKKNKERKMSKISYKKLAFPTTTTIRKSKKKASENLSRRYVQLASRNLCSNFFLKKVVVKANSFENNFFQRLHLASEEVVFLDAMLEEFFFFF